MTITEILNEDLERTIEEAKKVSPLDYKRHWVVFPKDEIHYSKNHNRLYGYWSYEHREAAGAKYNDGTVVHHKDHDKHDNKKSNLAKISRSEHAIIDPNARKHEKCRICGEPHFSQGLCQKHYMQKFRHGKFGNYDKSKNYSKSERSSVLTEINKDQFNFAMQQNDSSLFEQGKKFGEKFLKLDNSAINTPINLAGILPEENYEISNMVIKGTTYFSKSNKEFNNLLISLISEEINSSFYKGQNSKNISKFFKGFKDALKKRIPF